MSGFSELLTECPGGYRRKMLKRKTAVLLRAARETGGHDPYVSVSMIYINKWI